MMEDSVDKGWWVADVPCRAEECDELAAVLAETFGVGVHVEDTSVRLYLPKDRAVSDWQRIVEDTVRRFHASLGLCPMGPVRYGLCEETDWNACWKEGFKPLRIGRRLVVVPTWESFRAKPDDLVIHLDPGMAFGTGHHETTRLCLRWLEEVMEARPFSAEPSLLDVGTGSGILAIAGALLGFQPVVGVDNDPEAVRIAVDNRALNPAAASVEFLTGTVELVPGRFSTVVANIQAGPLRAMAEALALKVEPGGRLGLCGVLADQVQDVVPCYEVLGLEVEGQSRDGEWVLVSLRARRAKENFPGKDAKGADDGKSRTMDHRG